MVENDPLRSLLRSPPRIPPPSGAWIPRPVLGSPASLAQQLPPRAPRPGHVPPRLTAPNERRAFETYQEALALEAAGDAMAALPLYMRVGKLSAEVARVYRLV